MKRQRHAPRADHPQAAHRGADALGGQDDRRGREGALEVSEQTLHRWRNQHGGMKADDAKRLKELEEENRELKQIVADQTLDIHAYKEIAKGNF